MILMAVMGYFSSGLPLNNSHFLIAFHCNVFSYWFSSLPVIAIGCHYWLGLSD